MTTRKRLSQRTLVEVMQALEAYADPGMEPGVELESPVNFTKFLYRNDFFPWFVLHAETYYNFDWQRVIIDLRSSRFFFPGCSDYQSNITGGHLSSDDATSLGEYLNQRLAALAATSPSGEAVKRSLELDGFTVNEKTLSLVPLESKVSEQEEEDRLVQMVRQSGILNSAIILKHMSDAHDLFVQAKDHPSIGESRNFVQAIIDAIGNETHTHGGHSRGYPGGTKERLQYLEDVAFFTPDEKAAFQSAWGFLSAGTHPGVPPHELARIALILGLEFAQLLLLKFVNWSTSGYKRFK
jgi:hypothetical protein